jgi:hypothetical protein
VCVYVCVCVCMYVCIYVYVYVCVCVLNPYPYPYPFYVGAVPIPAFRGFSLKALSLLVRVVGAEIVVPEVRYLPLSPQSPESPATPSSDVLVGQYHLTRTHQDTHTR